MAFKWKKNHIKIRPQTAKINTWPYIHALILSQMHACKYPRKKQNIEEGCVKFAPRTWSCPHHTFVTAHGHSCFLFFLALFLYASVKKTPTRRSEVTQEMARIQADLAVSSLHDASVEFAEKYLQSSPDTMTWVEEARAVLAEYDTSQGIPERFMTHVIGRILGKSASPLAQVCADMEYGQICCSLFCHFFYPPLFSSSSSYPYTAKHVLTLQSDIQLPELLVERRINGSATPTDINGRKLRTVKEDIFVGNQFRSFCIIEKSTEINGLLPNFPLCPALWSVKACMSSKPGPVIWGFGTSTRRCPTKFTEPAHLDKQRRLNPSRANYCHTWHTENHPFLWRRIRRVRRIQVCMVRKGLNYCGFDSSSQSASVVGEELEKYNQGKSCTRD